jgi:hypothetical protein
VNNKTGVITVAGCPTPGSGNCLDFETKQHYYLTYKVCVILLQRRDCQLCACRHQGAHSNVLECPRELSHKQLRERKFSQCLHLMVSYTSDRVKIYG